MATSTKGIEREKLLRLAEEYRNKGYEVSLHPYADDVPNFLKTYRPDMIARRANEGVVIEVKSRSSLDTSSNQYLRNLAEAISQHSGWRFELVMLNREDDAYPRNAVESLGKDEVESRLAIGKHLVAQHLESAILYCWALVEATLRLVVEEEGLSLDRFDALYLLKQLVVEGLISKSEYQKLMNMLSLRNNISHGFKATPMTPESVHEIIGIVEEMLKAVHTSK